MGDKVIVDDEVTYTNNSNNFDGFQPALLNEFLNQISNTASSTTTKPPASSTTTKPPATKAKEEVVEEEVVEPTEVVEEEVVESAATNEVNKPGHLTFNEINNLSEEALVPVLRDKYGKDFEIKEHYGGIDAITIISKSNPEIYFSSALNTKYNRNKAKDVATVFGKKDPVTIYNDITAFIDENSPKANPSATTKSSVL